MPTRLITPLNWVVMGCAAIRKSLLWSARKVCVGAHPEGVMEGLGFSPIDPRRRSICALFFSSRDARITGFTLGLALAPTALDYSPAGSASTTSFNLASPSS
jgi:hypothetical protein